MHHQLTDYLTDLTAREKHLNETLAGIQFSDQLLGVAAKRKVS